MSRRKATQEFEEMMGMLFEALFSKSSRNIAGMLVMWAVVVGVFAYVANHLVNEQVAAIGLVFALIATAAYQTRDDAWNS